MPQTNYKVLLVKRPQGVPDESCFEIVESPLPKVVEGRVLVRILYISVDPYMRARMRDVPGAYALNEPPVSLAVAEVLESRSTRFVKGDYVTGMLPWEEYAAPEEKKLSKAETYDLPLTSALGVLGMTGMTAYFGLLDVGKPRDGETVVVSGAAGAVGSVVGQIARIQGCRAVGIAGSDQKTEYLKKELRFDAAINYHTEDLSAAIAEACPQGVDVYFDNVGGAISDAVLPHLNENARIPICGQISLYNLEETDMGPRVQPFLLMHHAMMKGFLQSQYRDSFPEARRQMAAWVKEDRIRPAETILEGLANVPNAFIGLFSGRNIGKMIVKI